MGENLTFAVCFVHYAINLQLLYCLLLGSSFLFKGATHIIQTLLNNIYYTNT